MLYTLPKHFSIAVVTEKSVDGSLQVHGNKLAEIVTELEKATKDVVGNIGAELLAVVNTGLRQIEGKCCQGFKLCLNMYTNTINYI